MTVERGKIRLGSHRLKLFFVTFFFLRVFNSRSSLDGCTDSSVFGDLRSSIARWNSARSEVSATKLRRENAFRTTKRMSSTTGYQKVRVLVIRQWKRIPTAPKATATFRNVAGFDHQVAVVNTIAITTDPTNPIIAGKGCSQARSVVDWDPMPYRSCSG